MTQNLFGQMPANANDAFVRRLKAKRAEIAKKEGKEPFMVLHNATLEETVRIMPKTLEDLKKIKGWGPVKIKKYGEEILSLLREKTIQDNAPSQQKKVFSVDEFLQLVNRMFERFGRVKIQGELHEVNASNGMTFFNLKDSTGKEAMLKCFLGRWNTERFSHLMEQGLEVVITGEPSVYPRYGMFRLVVDHVEPVGEGALQKAFEALKKKLELKGYFQESRKRPIPEFVRDIGLITSQSGAAITDFRRNLGEFGFTIHFIDVRVEGEYAENAIAQAIQWFNKYLPVDVLVLIRGGGGLENLKAFNSETVADAILMSRLPIITGVGHERDETIAGYTADKNFSTPTAVAVFLRKQRETLMTRLDSYTSTYISSMTHLFETHTTILERFEEKIQGAVTQIIERYTFKLANIAEQMQNRFARIFSAFTSLEHHFIDSLSIYRAKIQKYLYSADRFKQGITHHMERQLERRYKHIELVESKLTSLNPLAPLRRGYSIAYTNRKKILKDSKDARLGEDVYVKLYKGSITSLVKSVN